jgi:hypothetical protein
MAQIVQRTRPRGAFSPSNCSDLAGSGFVLVLLERFKVYPQLQMSR